MTIRIVHPKQQGNRISWFDSLFEKVEPIDFADTVPMEVDQPEVSELAWPQLDALNAAELARRGNGP